MANYAMGRNAKVYRGAAAAALAALTELSNVKDVTLTLEGGEVDVTTRANGNWTSTAQGHKSAGVEFEMQWKPTDAGFIALRDAYLNGTTVELAVLSGARDVAGVQGIKGAFSITAFTRTEPLTEAMTVSVSAKMETFSEYVEVATGSTALTFTIALEAGAGEIDLTAIPYGIGTYDGTGKRVAAVEVANAGANDLTASAAAENGYDLFGSSDDLVIPAAGHVMQSGTGGVAVDATHKLLTLAGTLVQSSTWTLTLVAVA